MNALKLALEHHGAGRLKEAEVLYRQVLEREPGNAYALHLHGVLANQLGERDKAVELIRQAAALQPSNPDIANSLGAALQDIGRVAEAERCFRTALALDPSYAEAHYNLGNALRDLGRQSEAERSYRQALTLNPTHAQAYNNLGLILRADGRQEEAADCLRQALSIAPHYAAAQMNLGTVLQDLGRFADAEACFRRLLESEPFWAEAHSNLGGVLQDQGRLGEAESCFRRAVALKPDLVDAHYNLGNALNEAGLLDQAERSYRDALALDPEFAHAHSNLGNVLQNLGRLDEAAESYRRALAASPDLAEAHSSLIFVLDLAEGRGSEDQQQERRRWYARHGLKYASAIRPHANRADPGRKLRLGYVSADFRRHSAYYLFSPIVRRHDPAAFEVFCYSGAKREDDASACLRKAVREWRLAYVLSDEALAEQIRRDEIDILIDLSGHTRGNRLAVFARKPAPVQITAWGHATGTGLETIDCFIADPTLVPPADRGYYAERVLDLPCSVCYEPPGYMPDVSPPPALGGEGVTFGCVNRLEKISDRVIFLWSRVLSAVPAARLLVKAAALDNALARERFLRRLGMADISTDRIVLKGATSHEENLRSLRDIDVSLDPFPHGGGVSTAEALWMGVPVVTLIGATPASRISASILAGAGLHEWIAESDDEYVRIAVEAARDRTRLAKQRSGMRARLAASPVGDAEGYTRAVESAYRELWRHWCEGRS